MLACNCVFLFDECPYMSKEHEVRIANIRSKRKLACLRVSVYLATARI